MLVSGTSGAEEQAVPMNSNVDELNSMLFEFLWFHITFSHLQSPICHAQDAANSRLTLIKTWNGPCQPYDGRYCPRPCDNQDENSSLLYFKLFVL